MFFIFVKRKFSFNCSGSFCGLISRESCFVISLDYITLQIIFATTSDQFYINFKTSLNIFQVSKLHIVYNFIKVTYLIKTH